MQPISERLNTILQSNELRTFLMYVLAEERMDTTSPMELPNDISQPSDTEMLDSVLNDRQLNAGVRKFVLSLKAFQDARGYLTDKQRESIKALYDSNAIV